MVERKNPKILLLEDERNVASTLLERLEQEGFDVTWTKTTEEAHSEIQAKKFDLVLLDVGLPDGSGFGVAEFLKNNQRATAIIFITAFGSPEDRIRGLELGAEDYIVKPFHLKELLLRVHNGLKRARYLVGSEDLEVRVGQAVFHFSRFEATVGESLQSLSHKECALMKFLVDRRGKAVSRDEILNEVWSDGEFPSPRTVDNFIMRLRRLVEIDHEHPKFIRTIRGVGYQLENE